MSTSSQDNKKGRKNVRLRITLIVVAFMALLHGQAMAQDSPGLHGMVVYGEGENIYLSHLPMFHAPHNYQVILKVSLDPKSAKAYREVEGRGIFTLAPEIFVLPEKAVAGAKFAGHLFKGHFEQGGTLLVEADVTVDEVIYFEKLSH